MSTAESNIYNFHHLLTTLQIKSPKYELIQYWTYFDLELSCEQKLLTLLWEMFIHEWDLIDQQPQSNHNFIICLKILRFCEDDICDTKTAFYCKFL